LSLAPIHASEAEKMGYQSMVFGVFGDKIYVKFAVYYEKNEDNEEVERVLWKEARLAHKVVLNLATDIQGKEHVISID
jgi:hypothetical protein